MILNKDQEGSFPGSKLFDVAKPGKTAAGATGRPVIAGQGMTTKQDPMVTVEKDTKVSPLHIGSEASIDPIKHEESETNEDVVKPETSEAATIDAVAGEVNSKKENEKEAAESAKRAEELEKIIESKQYFVPIHQKVGEASRKPLIFAAAVLILIALAWFFAMGPGKKILGFDKNSQNKVVSPEPQSANTKATTPTASDTESTKIPTQPANGEVVAYTKLKTIQADNGNFSAEVPELFQLSQQTDTITFYTHPKPNKTSTQDVYASLGVVSEQVGEANMAQVKQALVTQSKTKSSQLYESFRQSFLQQGLVEVDIGILTDFNGGLSASISGKDKNGNVGEGKVIILFGKANVYTTIIAADKAIWDKNAEVFKRVINSLKVK